MMHMHHLSPDPTSLACVCTSVRKAARAVSRGYDAALGPQDLNANRLSILRTIRHAGELPLSRLAELLVMDRTSVYRAIDPMVRAGWIAVDAAPRGRARIARLTPLGDTVTDGAAEPWEAAQTALVSAFGVERWRALNRELKALIATAVELDGSSAAVRLEPKR
jgi:DNA-binding MarR family transcriptional regulator